jgi:hypothetical protein
MDPSRRRGTFIDAAQLASREIQCHYTEGGDPYNGIIAHLTKKLGNVLREGGIVVTAENDPLGTARNDVNLAFGSCLTAQSAPDLWLCYDFIKRAVRPTHYSLCSGTLKSWVIEGSNTGKSWQELDRRENVDDLRDSAAVHVYPIAQPGPLQMIRVRQTGPNHIGDERLRIYAFEIFGSLFEDQTRTGE